MLALWEVKKGVRLGRERLNFVMAFLYVCVFTKASLLAAARIFRTLFYIRFFAIQDSVSNGFSAIDPDSPLVAIHDAARPLVTKEEIFNVLADAQTHGAIRVVGIFYQKNAVHTKSLIHVP